MMSFDFEERWPRVIEFREWRSLQGQVLGPEIVRHVSTPVRREGEWSVRDVLETRGGRTPEQRPALREVSRLGWRRDGLWQIGVLDGFGAYAAWDKPQLALPADAKPGTVWGTVHRRG